MAVIKWLQLNIMNMNQYMNYNLKLHNALCVIECIKLLYCDLTLLSYLL